jgi:hypothetical protein
MPIVTATAGADHQLDGDTLLLREGSIVVDTRGSAPVAVVLPDRSRVAVAGARVEVRVDKGALAAVQVFAGSAEVRVPGHRRAEIVAGEVWAPDAEATGVEWFRRGWIALRADDFATAIAAFDQANDPAIAEDAAFWGAIAQERAGATADARARFERFLTEFPTSIRADAARAHLAGL